MFRDTHTDEWAMSVFARFDDHRGVSSTFSLQVQVQETQEDNKAEGVEQLETAVLRPDSCHVHATGQSQHVGQPSIPEQESRGFLQRLPPGVAVFEKESNTFTVQLADHCTYLIVHDKEKRTARFKSCVGCMRQHPSVGCIQRCAVCSSASCVGPRSSLLLDLKKHKRIHRPRKMSPNLRK